MYQSTSGYNVEYSTSAPLMRLKPCRLAGYPVQGPHTQHNAAAHLFLS